MKYSNIQQNFQWWHYWPETSWPQVLRLQVWSDVFQPRRTFAGKIEAT
jgi:hypothetical protein